MNSVTRTVYNILTWTFILSDSYIEGWFDYHRKTASTEDDQLHESDDDWLHDVDQGDGVDLPVVGEVTMQRRDR